MVQTSGSVRFDKSEPNVFYYEPFQYSYYDSKNTLRNLSLNSKNNKNGDSSDEEEFLSADSLTDLEDQIEDTDQEYFKSDSKDSKHNYEKNSTFDDTSNNDSDIHIRSGLCNFDAVLHATLSENVPENYSNGSQDEESEPISQEKVSNATYFYKILYKLIDDVSDGTRFNCCTRSSVNPCESCKIIERLIFTYFDLTTLDDVIEERSGRGICGNIYCSNKVSKSDCKSKYKIDVVSKNIYNRDEYESFCSLLCMEESEKVVNKVSRSPVESGAFTPRAMRSASNDTLKTLYQNVFNLPNCYTTNSQFSNGMSHEFNKNGGGNLNGKGDKDMKEDKMEESSGKGLKVDTFEIYEDYESCDDLSESSISEVNVKFDKDAKNLISIYKSSSGPNLSSDYYSHTNYDETTSIEKDEWLEEEYLGVFSWLWYVLSNLITNNTRDFINSGIIQNYRFHEQYTTLYDSCLLDIQDELLPTLELHIRHLLSTFNPIKNNLLNSKIIEPLSYIIKYVVLINRHHLPFNYNKPISNFKKIDGEKGGNKNIDEGLMLKGTMGMDDLDQNEEFKEAQFQLLVENVQNVLYNHYLLDEQSIEILTELFLQI